MFTIAFLQQSTNGKLGHEEQLLKSEFDRRGIPVSLYTIKRILRRNLPLTKSSFIAGDIDAMHGAMRQLNIQVPTPNDYPKSLETFLHRKVWKSTLGVVERSLLFDDCSSVFVKPADRRKSFTGRVFESSDDFWQVGSVSKRQAVWCSNVVRWLSEFRIYIIDDKIVSIDSYAGDKDAKLDYQVLESAIVSYKDSGEAPSAYGMDFGLLNTGVTALIEVNEGFSLGAYSISAKLYTELLIRRWSELLSTAG